MTSLHKLSILATIWLLLLTFSLRLQAQTQSNMSALECRTATRGVESPLKKIEKADSIISIGKLYFKEIAYMYNKYLADYEDVLDSREEAAKVICRIQPGTSELNFAVGLDNKSKVTDREDIVLFQIYVENAPTEQKYIRQGEAQKVSINVRGVQNIAFKAECLRPEWYNNCPRLSFAEIASP